MRAPAPLKLEPDPADFEQRACHALLILSVAKEQLTALVLDAARNSYEISGAELLADIDAHLTDLGNEVSGALHKAAERLRESRYDGCRPGPFYRSRP